MREYEKINNYIVEAKNGNQKAKESIIDMLDPLIKKQIKGYASIYKKLTYEDFYQEASIAILEAIDDFDEEKGVYFLGFVKCKIQYQLLNLNKRNKKNEEVDSLNYVKSIDEDIEEIELLIDDDSNTEYILECKEEIELLKKGMDILTNREKTIFSGYYLEDKKLKLVAEELDISYRTAVNIKSNGMKRLKKYFEKNKIIKSRIERNDKDDDEE